MDDTGTRVPKNGVSRSKRLLEPQPLPHQYWGLELRTSLTKAGMVRNVVRNSPTHLASSIWRLLESAQSGKNALRIGRSCLWPLIYLRKRVQGDNEPMFLSK